VWNGGHLVAKVGTSKAGGTISHLGCGTSVACHGRPLKKKKGDDNNNNNNNNNNNQTLEHFTPESSQ
jgi:hypothetical protein